MLVSFLDAPGGKALVAGKSDRAIREIAKDPDFGFGGRAEQPLCCAHEAAAVGRGAKSSCDAAVTAAEKERRPQPLAG